jgi:hypothetical protein
VAIAVCASSIGLINLNALCAYFLEINFSQKIILSFEEVIISIVTLALKFYYKYRGAELWRSISTFILRISNMSTAVRLFAPGSLNPGSTSRICFLRKATSEGWSTGGQGPRVVNFSVTLSGPATFGGSI